MPDPEVGAQLPPRAQEGASSPHDGVADGRATSPRASLLSAGGSALPSRNAQLRHRPASAAQAQAQAYAQAQSQAQAQVQAVAQAQAQAQTQGQGQGRAAVTSTVMASARVASTAATTTTTTVITTAGAASSPPNAATPPAPPAVTGTGATPSGGGGQAARARAGSFRDRAVAGAKDLGIVTAMVGSTYLLADNELVFPFAIVACVATVSSVLVKYALSSMHGASTRARIRHLHHHRHFCGERAEYVRTNQRLAMMDRDFTPADYEMLLDLDNHSQRFRRFLEGASEETIARLPTFVYKKADPCDKPVSSMSTMPADPQNMGRDAEKFVEPHVQNGAAAASEDMSILGATARKCMICLEDFEDGMIIRTLPCLHRFMSDCIEPWLTQQAKCPVCKNGLDETMNSMPPGFS